jgi:hypothetical protein
MSRTEAIFCSYLPAPRFCPTRLSGFERYGDVSPTELAPELLKANLLRVTRRPVKLVYKLLDGNEQQNVFQVLSTDDLDYINRAVVSRKAFAHS